MLGLKMEKLLVMITEKYAKKNDINLKEKTMHDLRILVKEAEYEDRIKKENSDFTKHDIEYAAHFIRIRCQ